MLEIKNISKRYGETQVLKDFTLNIEKGKITTFVGANGAGKSTILSIIARLMKACDGQILLEGEPITNIKDFEMAKKVSVLKQTNNINVKLTIRELVNFGRFPYCKGRLKKEDIEAVNRALGYLNLTEIQDKYIDELSGGQRQRAYIAMIVAQDTEYILLDEPLNNLDMKHSVQIMKILRKLVDELGKTILVVIHDINFASCYSDNIVALKDGRLIKSGTACEMICKENLKEIFDIDFNIQEVNNNRICVYFK
ncbi:MAG: ATP-binding cassette domain-containing protein [Defluviitaleaceae bacterium]|nr:ATP-binding cassette domain-containing protein [Defluviitaleaceae bacterium]